jgi:muramidase (phage lysozyme)
MAVIETQPVVVRKFLDLIGWSEGTTTNPITKNDGYDVLVKSINGNAIFTDYSKHPFSDKPAVIVKLVPRLLSTAAGRYQILQHYFAVYKVRLNLPDFSPLSQDLIALEMIKERNLLHCIINGDIAKVITGLCTVWASFPGNNYNQGGKTMEQLLSKFNSL